MSDHGEFDDVALDELLGAYALDALDDDERRAVDEYLTRSPRARAEVQEHREVASMLAWSGNDAPEGLWDRIASSIEESAPTPTGQLAQVLSMDRTPATPNSGELQSRRRGMMRSVGSWAVAAAAAAVIAVVAVNVSRDDSPSPQVAFEQQVDEAFRDPTSKVVTLTGPSSGPVVRAVIEADGRGYVVGNTLPALAADQTYQLWGVAADGTVISLGLLGRDPGTESFRADGGFKTLAVTAEHAGGVVASKNDPVVVGAVY